MSFESSLIDDIRNKLLSSLGIIFIIIGTIGGLFNILLFKQRSLWTLSPCIPYLLASSVANMITLYLFVTLRVLFGFQVTAINNSSSGCKLQFFTFYTSLCLSSWFMVGCCADRFFSSSRNAGWRKYSSMRITRRTIVAMIIVTILLFSQVFYCYETNQVNTPGPCFSRSQNCRIVDTIFTFIFLSVGPPIVILAFGFGTFVHIRQKRQILRTSVTTITHTSTKIRYRSDRVILPMLVTQVTLYIVFSSPAFIIKLYSTLPLTIVKDDVRRSAESLILNTCTVLQLVDKTFAFYIYTLTSAHFRRELVRLLTRHRRIAPQN